MSFQFPSSFGGGGGGAVNSVNGLTGNVVITKASVGLANANNTSDANKPVSTAQQAALDLKQDLIASNNQELIFNNGGTIEGAPGLQVDATSGGLQSNLLFQPNGNVGNVNIHPLSISVDPLQNSPDESINLFSLNIDLDANDSGFSFGTNGNAATVFGITISHSGSGDVGAVAFFNNSFNLGNGTDPIDVEGISYGFGFGQVNANVSVTGPVQGWGFQPNLDPAALFTSYTNAFYDAANFGNIDGVGSYNSFSASPNIANIKTGSNYVGLNIGPNIAAFTGNASYFGVAVGGTLGDLDLSNGNANLFSVSTTFGDANSINILNGAFNAAEVNNFNGVYVNPNITLLNSTAYGIFVDVSNITGYAGTQSTLTIQDLTYEFNDPGDNNAYTIEYTAGGTAGSEVVTLLGNAITIQIQSGVSTATQIKAAVDGTTGINAAITVTISGVGGNAQVTDGPDPFVGGSNPATIRAAEFIGDVNIQGALSFTGALSVGQINAFASQALSNGGGTPSSVHSLITNPTAAANAVIANADLLGVNTAALINIGNNANITTAFLGVAALGLPAVVTLGTGATVDRVSGAVFAISMDAGAGGGTINEVALCRALGLPNGTTTTNRLYGYEMSLPFGSLATDQWGVWISPDIQNYFAGSLLIGGTPTSDDSVTNASVGLEIKSTTKAFLASRMDSAEEAALTAVNGMLIYNDQTHKFRGYANGSWVDLH